MKPPSLSGIEAESVVLAVDFGGTKVAAGIVDQTGVVTHHRVIQTASASGEDLYRRVLELAHTVLDDHSSAVDVRDSSNRSGLGNVVAVGVGCGGPMDTEAGLVSPGNVEHWRNFPLRDRLCQSLLLPTFLDNDAKALALGEGWVGAAQDSDNFMAMVVSTGVGGGIVLDRHLLDGRLGNAGHVGHMIAVPGGRLCSCGARGCLEAETSGTSIAAITGRPAAEARNELRVRTGKLIGRTVASVVNLLDLDLVVVAGSVALGFGEPFFTAAQKEITNYCHMDYAKPARIVPAEFSTTSSLIGAGAVAWYALSDMTEGVDRTVGLNKGSLPPDLTAHFDRQES